MKAIRFSVVLIVVALFSPPMADATIFTDNYVAPVVARGNGAGGTVWKTEICVSNPWDYSLIVIGATLRINALMAA